MKKIGSILFTVLMSFSCLASTGYAFAESEIQTESFGFSQITDFVNNAEGDYKHFEVHLSRDVLIREDGNALEYRIIDGANYPAQDYTYLLDYMEINGVTVAEINKNTDVTGWDFLEFPSSVGKPYNVPVMFFAGTASVIQIRIHRSYLTEVLNVGDDGLSGEGFTFTFKQGFNNEVVAADSVGDAISIKYVLDKDVSFKKTAEGGWSTDESFQNYVPSNEYIERADIDFSKIDYDTISLYSLSDIIEYGDEISVNGENRRSQYVCIYFDKPISNQYIPYATWGKKKLISLAPSLKGFVSLTETQINSFFDYRLDISLNDLVILDGKSIREWEVAQQTDGENNLYVHYSGFTGLPNSLTFYINGKSSCWLDRNVAHTLEIKEGFTTPLFGKTVTSKKFYYNPELATWSETDYSQEKNPVYDWNETEKDSEGSGCNGEIKSGTIALVALAAASLAIFYRRKSVL